ncbi:hypothetical protein [Maribacter sp. 2307ULW6-5]|uniref:hypothetical protein n=1 Tax=Maribacter sp. 2307ULW6-5 TaxID=3386275 RepID=UPI0039BD6AD8
MNFTKTLSNHILIFFLTFLSLTPGTAQKTTDEIAVEFIELFDEYPKKAFEYVGEMGLIDLSDETGFVRMADEVFYQVLGLGDYYGYEKINEHKAGNSYKRVRYLLKYEAKPIGLNMLFYKPHKIWLIGGVQLDYELHNELMAIKALYESKENKL